MELVEESPLKDVVQKWRCREQYAQKYSKETVQQQ